MKGAHFMEMPEIEFKRKIYDKMVEWKEKRAPNYALFLRDPRRVGKSTLANRLGYIISSVLRYFSDFNV